MGLFGRKKKEPTASSTSVITLENGETLDVANTIDCIGDSCPRPQLMTKKALGDASSGDVIEVRVDNPTSMEALPPIIEENGGTHLATLRQSRHWQVVARRN